MAIRLKGRRAIAMIHAWLAWAARSRIAAFVELGRKIRRNLPGIEAAMRHKLSNALIESTNTKLRVLHRMAFGFKKPEHLVALALLDRGGYCPPLPGRGGLMNPRMRQESPKFPPASHKWGLPHTGLSPTVCAPFRLGGTGDLKIVPQNSSPK